MIPPSSLAFLLFGGHTRWSMCGRRTRPFSRRAFREHIGRCGCPSNPFFPTFLLHQSGRHPHKRAVRGLRHCACRTSTASSCAFHEQEEPPNRPLHFLPHFFPLLCHL